MLIVTHKFLWYVILHSTRHVEPKQNKVVPFIVLLHSIDCFHIFSFISFFLSHLLFPFLCFNFQTVQSTLQHSYIFLLSIYTFNLIFEYKYEPVNHSWDTPPLTPFSSYRKYFHLFSFLMEWERKYYLETWDIIKFRMVKFSYKKYSTTSENSEFWFDHFTSLKT